MKRLLMAFTKKAKTCSMGILLNKSCNLLEKIYSVVLMAIGQQMLVKLLWAMQGQIHANIKIVKVNGLHLLLQLTTNMRSTMENLAFILNVIWQALILTTSTEHVSVAKPVQTSPSSSVVHNSFYCPPSLLPHHMQSIKWRMLQVTHAQPNMRFKT
jgi:hypothetical protein